MGTEKNTGGYGQARVAALFLRRSMGANIVTLPVPNSSDEYTSVLLKPKCNLFTCVHKRLICSVVMTLAWDCLIFTFVYVLILFVCVSIEFVRTRERHIVFVHSLFRNDTL